MRERLRQVAGTLERAEAGATARDCGCGCRSSTAPDGAHGMIRVLIAEDQAMVLGALAALIDIEQDLEVVGQAAIRARRRSQPLSAR